MGLGLCIVALFGCGKLKGLTGGGGAVEAGATAVASGSAAPAAEEARIPEGAVCAVAEEKVWGKWANRRTGLTPTKSGGKLLLGVALGNRPYVLSFDAGGHGNLTKVALHSGSSLANEIPAKKGQRDLQRVTPSLSNGKLAVYADYRDRLEPVAAIPTFTPDEAIAELDHAVGELGLKAVMLGGTIPRPYDSDPGGPGRWVDTLGHDSMYDYDPVWRRCEELGVAPTFHSGGQGWGTRMSTTNNSYNQVGNFAAADEGTCRSLVFGGVAKRFPNVHFAFQEGGVAWASALLAGLVGHWEKRNIEAIQHYNPANLDQALLQSLFAEHATGGIADRVDRLADSLVMLSDPDELPQDIDQFADQGY